MSDEINLQQDENPNEVICDFEQRLCVEFTVSFTVTPEVEEVIEVTCLPGGCPEGNQ